MNKVAKIIFSDVNDKNIRVSFAGKKKIIVPYFNGKFECCIVDENEKTIRYKDVFDNILQTIGDSQYVNDGYIVVSQTERINVPKMNYSDVTEKLVINGEEIMEGNLVSQNQGMLAFTGIRKLKVEFNGQFFPISLENNQMQTAGEINISSRFRVDNADGKILDDIIYFEESNTVSDGDKSIIMFDLDTDELGRVFESKQFKDSENVVLDCMAEVKVKMGKIEYLVEYPVKIALINTMNDKCRQECRHAASIDFGTTSTCVAIETTAGKELLTISESADNSSSKYENPTNLMMFDWESLFKTWIEDNKSTMPILCKGGRQDYKNWDENGRKNIDKVDFDFGYPVRNELGAQDPIADSRTINSILSLIKMIPYRVLQEKRDIKFSPFGDQKKFIYITTDPEKQDAEHFDPVAFYGYLIGRAINDRSRHQQIHTKFMVTSPVKFNLEIKESIRKSLYQGLIRTVPKPMMSHVKVEMSYDEPVAYIGAICGTDYFKVDNTTEKFAVYDFGGGTLDFSFGQVSNDDEGETTIDVFMVGGRDNIGGESLIERMTFQIYCKNYDQMKEHDIPIEKPEIERLPDEIESKLVISDQYSNANMNIINYAVSRKIFEGKKVENKKVRLYDRKGDTHEVELLYDEDALKTFLNGTIRESIEGFRNEMIAAFHCEDGNVPQDVNVFLAGNSSKNEFVMTNMQSILGERVSIKKPDDSEIVPGALEKNKASQTAGRRKKDSSVASETTDNVVSASPEMVETEPVKNSNANIRYSITPKTAVALGQLKLNNFRVNIDKESFKLYVGFFNSGSGKFICRLKKGDSSSEWVKFKKINNGKMDVFYSESKPADGSESLISYKTLDLDEYDGKVLFVRFKDQYVIEYCIGDNDDPSSIASDAVITEERFD
ncbi:MAG: hypothetical protein ACI4SF_14135 [Oscillospiraceae bacterium]